MASLNYPYLNDENFLKELDLMPIKELIVSFTLLDWDELPIKEISGKVISGNLNLDGNSAIRRTASLSVVVEDGEDDTYLNLQSDFAINKKLELKMGYINTTDQWTEYSIIWFPLGVYIIGGVSLSRNLLGVNLSVSLKDKMCLLNGECGGMFSESVQLDNYEEYDFEHGTTEIKKTKIYDIIREVVHHYGGIAQDKIIINDVPLRIKTVMRWTGLNPVYISNLTDVSTDTAITISVTPKEGLIEYGTGEDVGYIFSDFYYANDLIMDAGSSVCDALDKIKGVLGNYEYFFDLSGNFVFQEIKNYLNTTQATVELDKINNSNFVVDMGKGKSVYKFDNSVLVTAYTNSPNYANIKNDFIIWGVRKGVTGQELPIRYHLAIDEKPSVGNEYIVRKGQDGNGDVFYKVMPDGTLLTMEILVTMSKGDDYKTTKTEQVISLTLNIKTKNWQTELYMYGSLAQTLARDEGYYFKELVAEWPKLCNIEGDPNTNPAIEPDTLKFTKPIAIQDYWLDFIDTTAPLGRFSVKNIGRRTKVVNDSSINCIFEPEVPDVVWIENAVTNDNYTAERNECELKKLKYCNVPLYLYDNIAVGGMYNSAYEAAKDLLYQYTNYNESITIQSIPIYHLEPNSRITVNDLKTGIEGDYVILSISLPLNVGGTMSISANKVLIKI